MPSCRAGFSLTYGKQSAEHLTAVNFDGLCHRRAEHRGTKERNIDITEQTTALLPSNKPRYLMGVGAPEDVVDVSHGASIYSMRDADPRCQEWRALHPDGQDRH